MNTIQLCVSCAPAYHVHEGQLTPKEVDEEQVHANHMVELQRPGKHPRSRGHRLRPCRTRRAPEVIARPPHDLRLASRVLDLRALASSFAGGCPRFLCAFSTSLFQMALMSFARSSSGRGLRTPVSSSHVSKSSSASLKAPSSRPPSFSG